MVVEKIVTQLEQNYAQQLIAYQKFFQLTSQLEELCAKGDMNQEENVERLVQLLDGRQRVIQETEELNKANNQLGEAWQKLTGLEKLNLDTVSSLPGVNTSKLSELMIAREKLLEKIIQANNRCGADLAEKLKAVGAAIDKIQVGKQLNKAYNVNEYQSEGFFFDQKK